MASFDDSGLAVLCFLDEGGEGVVVVADLGEEGEAGGVVGGEHRGETAGGGGVAEGAEYLGLAGMAGVDEGAAALGFVAENPDGASIVQEVGSLIFDVELAGEHALVFDGQGITGDIVEEQVAFATALNPGPDAAQDERPVGGVFDAAADVREVLEEDGVGFTRGDAEVGGYFFEVVDVPADAEDSAGFAAQDDGGIQGVGTGEEDRGCAGIDGGLDGDGGILFAGGVGAEGIDDGP